MSWRIVAVTNPARLSLKNHNLLVAQEEEVTLPIEDIDILLLDSYGIQLSSNLLASLSVHGVTVIICDDKHTPVATVLPHEPHSRELKVVRSQLSMSEPFKKRLWQKIVESKIFNQADALKFLDRNDVSIRSLIKGITSGDTTNREAYASRLYFTELFEKKGTRSAPSKLNSGMNYCYAIVRSSIAKHLACYGFITSIGIHHTSELNNFNLADDLIEPFRPIVDIFVYELLRDSEGGKDLTKEDRMRLLDILNISCRIDNRNYTVHHAIELFVKMFSSAVQDKDLSRLVFPYVQKNYENDGDV